jgi:uncharacterized protein YfaS (alpha-2-macroglobulin family)
MKKLIIFILISMNLMFFLSLSGSAADIKQADELFEKNTFQEALEIYQTLFKDSKDENIRWKAFFRSCESLAHLFRYGEAAQMLISTPPPVQMPHRARILILKAEIFRNFLMQYSNLQRLDVIEGEEQDIFRRTPGEIEAEIKKTYAELWTLQQKLIKMDLKEEGYFLDIKDTDFGMYPTLFDYLILNWTEQLLNVEARHDFELMTQPDASQILDEEFNSPVDLTDPPALLAAELMEEASRQLQRNRIEAGERWKIRRLLLPVKLNNIFNLKAVAEDKSIYDGKDYSESRALAKKILVKWMESFKSQEAKAEAGYETAVLLNSESNPLEAVRLCEMIERDFPGTHASRHAKSLRSRIQMPSLYLRAKTALPPGREALAITARNLTKVFFRLYRIEPESLKKSYLQPNNNAMGWSSILNYPRENWLKEYLPGKSLYKEWDTKIKEKIDHQGFSGSIDLPELETGIYLVFASSDESFKMGSSLMAACFLNITNFVLVGTGGFSVKAEDAYYDFIYEETDRIIDDKGFRFYTLDAQSGKPVENSELDIFTYQSQGSIREFLNLTTNRKGLAELSFPVAVAPRSSNQYRIDPLARSENSFAYWRYQHSLNYYPPSALEIFIETDRPIYRPGHILQAKVIVVKRRPQGFKTLSDRQTVRIYATDPNGKEFFHEDVELNDFSSASINFEIPHGRLLGRYRLHAGYSDGRFSNHNSVNFTVEEYKRPEFEILLKPSQEPWKYEKQVEILGQSAYYFGGPVPDAPIKYRIKHQTYIPYYYRHWFNNYSSGSGQEIAAGELITDSKGNFVIPFTPAAPPQRYGYLPEISQYSVEVEGRDSGGRTITAQQSYKAGKSAAYFVLEPQKGFFFEKEKIDVKSTQLTINDSPVPGESDYVVYRLVETPAKTLAEIGYGYRGGNWNWLPPLDIQLKDVSNGEKVHQGKVKHDKNGIGNIGIPSLPQGAYRIVQKTKDKWEQEISQNKIFVVAKSTEEAVPVNASSVTLVERGEYRIGDVARFVIGSGITSGIYHIELWAGNFFLEHKLIEDDRPVNQIDIPVTEKMKGGFCLRWFGVKDFDVYYGQATVSVPWTEKKLAVTLKPFEDELEPGQDVNWGVNIRDAEGKPVKGEVLGLMYDRSLEYYMTSQNPWLDRLYALRTTPVSWNYSVFDPSTNSIPVTEGLLAKLMLAFRQPPEEPKPPSLRTWRTFARGDHFRYSRGAVEEGAMMLDAAKAAPLSQSEANGRIGLEAGDEDRSGLDYKSDSSGETVKTRKEFADTAFFKPHIVTDSGGRQRLSFTVPEQLASWKVKVFAFDKDVREGTLTEEAVTKKELMVRADLPRYFREKDKGTVTAIVHNESEEKIEGELFIDITEDGQTIHKKIKLGDNKKYFSIDPHSLETFDWIIEIPNGIGTYKVRVAAVTEKLSDAEERDLPILPSRQRLIESAMIALQGNESKALEIPHQEDQTRINESMVLQIEPQLALSLLNTIPFLIEYPYECVEQILNKFVPLSIMNEIYKKYPAIQQAVAKIPDRKTPTPPWEKDAPQRLLTLMETPWVWQSEGRPTIWPIIDMLDPEIVEAQKESTFNRLKSAQLANGAFPWWPGGEADPYITLYVLSGLAEARRYGVEVPNDMIQRALTYVNQTIPLMLKPEERYLATVSYAAYVVTSYSPQEFSEAKTGFEAAKSWVVFLERHIHALTPLGKAYLAFTFFRLGDRDKAEETLDAAMDGTREDKIAGVYWTPEKYSWVWYSDTVEKHAFFLRTLQELRPEDKRIPGMVRWLLFNRKGTVWKSTKASVAAVYALLDHLEKLGALASDETFKVTWAEDIFSQIVKADDWLDEPIRWQKKGFEITPQANRAEIEKNGPGIAFASLTWTYSSDQLPEESAPGMLNLQRKFFRRIKEGDSFHLKPISSGEEVNVGDQIEVQITINTRSQFEYMHLKDPKASGFEAETLLSGWKRDPLWFYQEQRDSLTNFFISRLPHGEYILRYRLKPTKPGIFRIGASTLQSMYSPDMSAHSAGFIIEVVK